MESPGPFEESLRTALIDGLGLEAAACVPGRYEWRGHRTADIAAAVWESIELLGRERTLARLAGALALAAG